MFKINLYWFLVFYLSLFTIFFFFSQLRERFQYRNLKINPRFIWHCAICTHTYIDTHSEFFSICPQCGCYNTRDL
ncbi:MAG: hypothetical protein NC909_01675 [Candidatus Omnitrophica bacterium]|nr:hypothetical protein [Candidatus Omnitrophota bacterium]